MKQPKRGKINKKLRGEKWNLQIHVLCWRQRWNECVVCVFC